MDVEVQELLGLRLEAGGDGAIERVRWSRLGDSTRRRFGGGLHILNLDRARARDESRCEQGRRDHSPFARHTHSKRVCTAGLGGLKTTLRPADPSARNGPRAELRNQPARELSRCQGLAGT
jgi:hypothetical protein